MSERIECAGLSIDATLHALVTDEIAPGTGITAEQFWQGVADIWADLGPDNTRLLAERDSLQSHIDQWHREHRDAPWDAAAYQAFLTDIGYLCPQPEPFQISTEGVDPEIAQIAGPQLVVPVMNARFALNAANARWGSLYDALYGTDAIAETDGAERGGAYNAVRGDRVIAWARRFLDTHFPVRSRQSSAGRRLRHHRRRSGDRTDRRVAGSTGGRAAMGGLYRESRHAR